MTFRLGNRSFTADDCSRYVQLYNAGYYAPARASNVEADARGYRLFERGLAQEMPELTCQLVFIGKEFGGAKAVPFERVSRAIGERILAADGYHHLLAEQPSMEQGDVSAVVVQQLLAPFLKLPPEAGRKRNFVVWASKVLHFSRLDALPVRDSAAVLALALPSSIAYAGFVRRYRPTFLSALADLRAVADVDPHSPTLLRRFDKILYQYGSEL